jgi:hypothetical protein
MKTFAGLMFACLCGVSLTGCVSVRLGTGEEPPSFAVKGAGTAYAAMPGVTPYDGTILSFDLFRGGANSGELVSLHLWPIGGIDLGLLGIRAKFFPWEAGAGTLFYNPTTTATPAANVDVDVKTRTTD